MMVIKPKHVGAVLIQILIFLLKQFSCESVGKQKTLVLEKIVCLDLRTLNTLRTGDADLSV
jgi:hypothetical protein